jgi:tetratricopeptide (TPR) repeat protein
MKQRVDEYPDKDTVRADLQTEYGFALLDQGRASEALEQFQEAADIGREEWSEIGARYGLVEAQAELGRNAAAQEALSRLEELQSPIPGNRGRRGEHQMRGRIALTGGDSAKAVTELESAESLLPPNTGPRGNDIDVRYDLAVAYLAAGKSDEANLQLERVVERSASRATRPVEYVRSLYLLGEIAEQQDDRQRARDHYKRFLDHWGDGDIDREQVEHARQFVGPS